MSPSRAYYVTACQQLLALGVVVIALVPATRVITLDVVGVRPGAEGGPSLTVPGEQVADPARSEQRRTARGPERARSVRVAERRGSAGQVGEDGALVVRDRGQAGAVVGARDQDQRAR
jgi:hypothetical protein